MKTKTLDEEIAMQTLLDKLLQLPKLGLCLDFDGTLVPIAPHPDAISVAPDLPGLLSDLAAQLDGRLAIITGRTHADLSGFLDVTAFPVAASHGAQFSTAGSADVEQLIDAAGLDPVRPKLAAMIADLPGVRIEDKGTALAVHVRDNPGCQSYLFKQMQDALSSDENLSIKSGKAIVEVSLAGKNKGTAIHALMQQPGWQGATPVMLGDDTTDDAGMEVAKQYGGLGIQVGEGPDGCALTHASVHLPDVEQAHALLRMLTRLSES